MNIIIRDTETDTVLYGQESLGKIIRTGKSEECKVFHMTAEAWIAALGHCFADVPEVAAYLKACHETKTINPEDGRLLAAVDNTIEIDEEFAQKLLEFDSETH
ncbi:MAG: hypothetical protein WB586_12290 [Chthoniobacterales bacterium]